MPKDFLEKIARIHHNIVRMPLLPYSQHCDVQGVQNKGKDYSHNFHDYAGVMNKKKTPIHACSDIMSFALEKQAQDFLSQYYNEFMELPIEPADELELYITIWNYEASIYSVWHAQEQSFFYKERFATISYEKLSYKNLLDELHGKLASFTLKKSIDVNFVEDIQKISPLRKQSREEISLSRKQFIHEIRLLHKQFLEQIPCTTSYDIACNSDAFLAVGHDDVDGVISVETSGTSARSQENLQNIGQKTETTLHPVNAPIISSKRVYCSSNDLQRTIDFFFYGMQNMLCKENNKVALLMSGVRQGSVGDLVKKAMDMLGVNCKVFGFPVNMKETTKDLLKYEPTCIIGVPSHILSLSYHVKNTKLVDALDCVLLSGDSVTTCMRQQISENLVCDVFLHYGLTETGLGCAVECKEHAGLHMRQLDLYVEILDDDLQTVQDGIMGEIVITTLTREAMPLIRYRTGDMGRLVSGVCKCGSALQRLEVKGRIQQSISLGENISVHITTFQEFFYAYPGIIDFELCVFTDNASSDIYNHSCLVIGIDFNTNKESDYLDILKKDFAKTFNIFDILPNTLRNLETNICKENFQKMTLKKNENTGIVTFCIIPMNMYKKIIEHDTYNIVSKLSVVKNKVNAFGAKKCIRYMQGSLPDMCSMYLRY